MATSRKGYLPKEEYDELYYYMGDGGFSHYMQGDDPIRHASRRRYHTIQEVRKSALAKSKKNLAVLRDDPWAVGYGLGQYVFKGRRYVGCVKYNDFKGTYGGVSDQYDGLWYPVEHPMDALFLLSDGSIGTKKARRRP